MAKKSKKDDFISSIAKNLRKPLCVFDLETTGIDTNTAEVIQFAGVRINLDGSSKELKLLCKPKNPIPKEASDIHGITDEMVKNEKPFFIYLDQVKELFDGCDIGGYNIKNYDCKIMCKYVDNEDFFKDAIIFDSYTIYLKHSPRKLVDAVKFYLNEEIKDAHDAMGDVLSTAKILSKQIEKEGTTEKLTELLASSKQNDRYFNKDAEGQICINFGKHKGTKLKEADKGYLSWILKGDFPKSVKDIVKDFV